MIHPTAQVDEGVELGRGVEIGAYAVIGAGVTLGPGVRVDAHVNLEGPLRVGADARIHPFAAIGGPAQDRRPSPPDIGARIGEGAEIREYVTINRGTERWTAVGDGAMIMAYSHIGHDCQVGDRVVLANRTTLAGHVEIAADVNLGGMVGVHQFTRVGRLAFAAANSMIERDLPPFCRCAGDRAKLVGLNIVGIRRAGFGHDDLKELKDVYRALFRNSDPLARALAESRERVRPGSPALELIEFAESSTRGICR